eukprot:4491262-Prorocentrum_lima.AAC.1
MTSSLVGSEMCIRDRPTCLRSRFFTRQQPESRKNVRRGRRRKKEDIRTCLLYTSDAADDM